MQRIKSRVALGPAAALALLALAGCGGGGGMMAAPSSPGGPPRIEDQFGARFGMTFRQDRNTAEPVDPQPGDVDPLNLTTEPRDVG